MRVLSDIGVVVWSVGCGVRGAAKLLIDEMATGGEVMAATRGR